VIIMNLMHVARVLTTASNHTGEVWLNQDLRP